MLRPLTVAEHLDLLREHLQAAGKDLGTFHAKECQTAATALNRAGYRLKSATVDRAWTAAAVHAAISRNTQG